MARVRVSIHEELHPWLTEMSNVTGIQDQSRLVGYLLQRVKDQTVFGCINAVGGSTAIAEKPQTTNNTEIEVDGDW